MSLEKVQEKTKFKIVITGAGGVTARAVARSLKRSQWFSDAHLIGIDVFDNQYEVLEQLFDALYKLPYCDAPDYRSRFLKVMEREAPDAVLIMTEKEAIYWSAANPLPALLPSFSFAKTVANKLLLHDVLEGTGLVPKFRVVNTDRLHFEAIWNNEFASEPVWVRAYDEGSSTGKGSFLVSTADEFQAWVILNKNIRSFMVSEYLPGGNYACNLLFHNGKLIKYAIYERLRYFMSHLSMSGITGNISVGRLINDEEVFRQSLKAIRICEAKTDSVVNGLLTVDLKGDRENRPVITEINLRHTAATEAFALGGCNMAAYHALATLGLLNQIPKEDILFPANNLLLRDLDGFPLYTENYQESFRQNVTDFST